MNRMTFAAIVLACSLVGAGCASERYAYRTRQHAHMADSTAIMTNHDVIALSKSRVGDNVIINLINVSPTNFQLRPQDVVMLADSGVSDTVISAMINVDNRQASGEGGRGYAYYPPYYWYAGVPYWYPWYPWYSSFYFGFGSRFYRPAYYSRWYAPYYGVHGRAGFYGGRSFGGGRAGGGRR